jgi:hypothetical protein
MHQSFQGFYESSGYFNPFSSDTILTNPFGALRKLLVCCLDFLMVEAQFLSQNTEGIGVNFMPNSKHQLVRLLACVICSCVVLGFTVSYTGFEIKFYSNIWMNGTAFSQILIWVCDYGRWTFAIPLIGLVIGLRLLYKHPQSLAIFEFLIFCIWLLTIIAVGYWFLAWQLELNHVIGGDQIIIKDLLHVKPEKPD